MKLYIESIPLDSERKANKLIHICEERDLIEQSKFFYGYHSAKKKEN